MSRTKFLLTLIEAVLVLVIDEAWCGKASPEYWRRKRAEELGL